VGDSCHGFSAGPTYDLTTYVVGLSPAEPRYARARLDPFLGPLQWTAGSVPTPHGWIRVRIDRNGVDLLVPSGVEVLLGERIESGEHHVDQSVT
jgi:alpha-L-rhamnosidase